jgi:hypothetical protein
VAVQPLERVASLILCDTATIIPPPQIWRERTGIARSKRRILGNCCFWRRVRRLDWWAEILAVEMEKIEQEKHQRGSVAGH